MSAAEFLRDIINLPQPPQLPHSEGALPLDVNSSGAPSHPHEVMDAMREAFKRRDTIYELLHNKLGYIAKKHMRGWDTEDGVDFDGTLWQLADLLAAKP